ncbi:MAG: PilZ domain-containing protein [Gemmataceae bacterium]
MADKTLHDKLTRVQMHLTEIQQSLNNWQKELKELQIHILEIMADLQEQSPAEIAQLRLDEPDATAPPPPPRPKVLQIGSRPERRLNPRRKGNLVQVVVTDAAGSLEPFPGWVVDRSTGGIGLLVDEAVTPGTVLSLRPIQWEGDTGWVQVEVKSCRQQRNSWNLGCQFLQKLTWDELHWFG